MNPERPPQYFPPTPDPTRCRHYSRSWLYESNKWFQCVENTYLDSDGYCMIHCPYGLDEHNLLNSLFTVNPNIHNDKIKKFLDGRRPHYEEFHGLPPRKVEHTGNGAYKGAFAFTLTKSPDDDLTEEDMICAVKKIMNQKSCPTKKFAWYLEYGDEELKTHPHIHGLYETETGGMIETKHWKRAWRIWNPKEKLGKGFRGGYHRPIRDDENYDDYIKKQNHDGQRFNC